MWTGEARCTRAFLLLMLLLCRLTFEPLSVKQIVVTVGSHRRGIRGGVSDFG